jgi:hypothetical protein
MPFSPLLFISIRRASNKPLLVRRIASSLRRSHLHSKRGPASSKAKISVAVINIVIIKKSYVLPRLALGGFFVYCDYDEA